MRPGVATVGGPRCQGGRRTCRQVGAATSPALPVVCLPVITVLVLDACTGRRARRSAHLLVSRSRDRQRVSIFKATATTREAPHSLAFTSARKCRPPYIDTAHDSHPTRHPYRPHAPATCSPARSVHKKEPACHRTGGDDGGSDPLPTHIPAISSRIAWSRWAGSLRSACIRT